MKKRYCLFLFLFGLLGFASCFQNRTDTFTHQTRNTEDTSNKTEDSSSKVSHKTTILSTEFPKDNIVLHLENFEEIMEYFDSLAAYSETGYAKFNVEDLSQERYRWHYANGLMVQAFLGNYELTKKQKFLDFSTDFLGGLISENGNIETMNILDFNLDNINSGKALLLLNDLDPKPKYRKALDILYLQLQNQPKTTEGNFYHKKVYSGQVWLDGTYMALPFYMDYTNRYVKEKKNVVYDDIFKQISFINETMKDPETKLLYHAYSESPIFWANESGLSSSFWSRSIGWYLMALIDIIGQFDNEERESQLETYKCLFKELVDALLRYVDPYYHMLRNVTNVVNDEKNYLETSSSSMLSYAILKGVFSGVLEPEYFPKGEEILKGIISKYFFSENSCYNLGGICLTAGLGVNETILNKAGFVKDGSYEYYLSEQVVTQDAKGVGPFFLALNEEIKIMNLRK